MNTIPSESLNLALKKALLLPSLRVALEISLIVWSSIQSESEGKSEHSELDCFNDTSINTLTMQTYNG